MHRVVDGRIMRVLSLDSDPLSEPESEAESLGRLMRRRPTPDFERRSAVVTRNGNVVQRVTR